MSTQFDIAIIGGGPAGIACAIAAQKAKLNYVILEKGFLVNSIYNFPSNMTFFSTSKKLEIGDIPFISHHEKPTRSEALEYYRRIVSSYDLNIKLGYEVTEITKDSDHFKITSKKEKLFSKHIIIATGYYDTPRNLNVPGEDLAKVKHYYDDAHPYINKNIVVVGAANSACDVALETWQKGANVTMVIRGANLYPKVKYWILPNIENRIKEGSIKAYFESEIKEIKPDSVIISTPVETVHLQNDYVLAMTGYKPDFKMLESFGIKFDKANANKPELNSNTLESNIKGIYVAGVVVSGTNTSELFIENTRHHGETIIEDILKTLVS